MMLLRTVSNSSERDSVCSKGWTPSERHNSSSLSFSDVGAEVLVKELVLRLEESSD